MATPLDTAFDGLVSGGCMQRTSFASSAEEGAFTLPIYVAHARKLRRRRAHIDAQLTRVRAVDVTFVLCADADAVASLTRADYAAVHPSYTRTAWSLSLIHI